MDNIVKISKENARQNDRTVCVCGDSESVRALEEKKRKRRIFRLYNYFFVF